MNRYLLAAMGMLAVSACSDNRPNNMAPSTSDTTSTNEMDHADTSDGLLGADRTPSPANTADDHRGRRMSALTAGDQSESEGDRRITQAIRKAAVDDPALSMKAKNCTIVTINGVVTLRGTVDSEDERRSIGSMADSVSGVHQVDNLLVVAP